MVFGVEDVGGRSPMAQVWVWSRNEGKSFDPWKTFNFKPLTWVKMKCNSIKIKLIYIIQVGTKQMIFYDRQERYGCVCDPVFAACTS